MSQRRLRRSEGAERHTSGSKTDLLTNDALWRLTYTVRVLMSCGTRNKPRIPPLVALDSQWPALLTGVC